MSGLDQKLTLQIFQLQGFFYLAKTRPFPKVSILANDAKFKLKIFRQLVR